MSYDTKKLGKWWSRPGSPQRHLPNYDLHAVWNERGEVVDHGMYGADAKRVVAAANSSLERERGEVMECVQQALHFLEYAHAPTCMGRCRVCLATVELVKLRDRNKPKHRSAAFVGRLAAAGVLALALLFTACGPADDLTPIEDVPQVDGQRITGQACSCGEGPVLCPRGDPNSPCGPCSRFGTPEACRASQVDAGTVWPS